ncbi:EAL domain-containing protein [Chthonobacter albigriseus]|uniref:EAL domain-containing protein n=1 Tax=Chthonobacter albigriseus TaxID=1683161 RepID=UPI0015EE6E8E|nr:EAL domain-containing protein [Chthonobacter albigriseus]
MTRYLVGIESAGLGVWDADLQTGQCYYSPAWKAMLGYGPDEIDSGWDIWLDLIHPDDKDQAIRSGDEHMAGLTPLAKAEFRMRHKDGHWVWVLDRGKVVARDPEGRPTRMVGVQTDITERKTAERQIEILAERVQLAVEAGGIGLWHYLIGEDQLVADRRAHEIFGTDPTRRSRGIAGWAALLHPDDRERAQKELARSLREDKPFDTVYRIVRPSGEIRHVRAFARTMRQSEGEDLLIGTCWDVTEQVTAAEALASEKERLRITLQSIADAVICTDVFGRVSFMNLAAEILTGFVEPLAVGNPLEAVFKPVHEETGEALPSLAREAIRLRRAVEQPHPAMLIRRDGDHRSIRDIGSPVIAANGEVVGAVLVVQDVTAARALQRDLAHAATHDSLTGLKNRSFFAGALGRAIEDAQPHRGEPSVLLYVDLDRFKILNDTAGHHAGDALLRQVATRIAGLVRRQDVVARLGGDEFACLLLGCQPEQAEHIAQTIVDEIGQIRFPWGDRVYEIGASVGVAMLDCPGLTAETALSQADVACYAAKAGGRNRVSVYRPDSGDAFRHMADLKMAAGIKDAIQENRFRLYGQEIRDLHAPLARGRSVELLTRMVASDGTVVMPGAFIPPAERFELMAVLDRWVLRTAIRDFGAAIMAIPGLTIAVNLSANSLSDPGLWPYLSAELQAGSLHPSRLTLEITETAMINNFVAAERFVSEARAFGCRISLDDFGSGVSSFSYLKRFRVDAIKIDGAFVRQIGGNGFDRTIVRLIGEVAAGLGIEAIAECIEDTDALEALAELGVRYGQGFLFHRPEPLGDLLAALGGTAADALPAKTSAA